MEPVKQFEGKGVVVTGVFGRGIAKAFAAEGAKVCVSDRDQEALAALAQDAAHGCTLLHIQDRA